MNYSIKSLKSFIIAEDNFTQATAIYASVIRNAPGMNFHGNIPFD